jgi:hypothetical protein
MLSARNWLVDRPKVRKRQSIGFEYIHIDFAPEKGGLRLLLSGSIDHEAAFRTLHKSSSDATTNDNGDERKSKKSKKQKKTEQADES